MEEQGSIVLQKKNIVAVFTIIFTFTSIFYVMVNKTNSSKIVAVANDNKVEESSKLNFEGNEDDIVLIEQISYAAAENIDDTIEALSEEEESLLLANRANRINKSELTVSRKATREDIREEINIIENAVEEQIQEEQVNQTTYISYKDLAEDNPPTEYKEVIQATATAYCLCKKCCGKLPSDPNYGCTASGIKIVPGTGMKVIAVDPKVIPLGTKVYVDGLNGAWDYGYAVAADTGSAIKNLKIDLYMDTHEDALSWGRRSVNIYVVE